MRGRQIDLRAPSARRLASSLTTRVLIPRRPHIRKPGDRRERRRRDDWWRTEVVEKPRSIVLRKRARRWSARLHRSMADRIVEPEDGRSAGRSSSKKLSCEDAPGAHSNRLHRTDRVERDSGDSPALSHPSRVPPPVAIKGSPGDDRDGRCFFHFFFFFLFFFFLFFSSLCARRVSDGRCCERRL